MSGVMAPGVMTAATIAKGARNRWAGSLIAVGHGIVEIPLIFLLMLGLDLVLKTNPAKIAIGILGGGFLLWMGSNMLRQLSRHSPESEQGFKNGPIATGVILSATNPYFLFWWATVGLNLAINAKELGTAALVLFAVAHWLCDLIWLSALSLGAFITHRGAGLFSNKIQKAILIFCGIALLCFGVKFMFDAFWLWIR